MARRLFLLHTPCCTKIEDELVKISCSRGDYTWDNPGFHDEWALQRGLTFIDVGDAKGVEPTKENTMLCHPELDVLCLRDWFAEAKHTGAQDGNDMTKMPRNIYTNKAQMDYAGYYEQIELPGRRRGGSLLLHEDGTLKNTEERAKDVAEMLRRFPSYWDKGNLVDLGPPRPPPLVLAPKRNKTVQQDKSFG